MAVDGSTIEGPAGKQERIADHLRQMIVRGKVGPGGRLPTQVQLLEQFGVSGVTVQRALDRLSRDGFIETRGRHGTFVADRPPHLTNYALVYCEPHEEHTFWSRFYGALESQALQMQRSQKANVATYHGVAEPAGRQYQKLLDDARSDRLAGLILVNPYPLRDTALLEEPQLVRAAIMNSPFFPWVPTVFPDVPGLIELALDQMVETGCSRVAVMITGPMYRHVNGHLRQSAADRGLALPEQWLQIVPHDIPDAARNAAHLLVSGHDRPEGLLILDDNLIESASSGLVAADADLDELTLVAHCNFPHPVPSVLPMRRVGFHIGEVMDKAVELIDRQRQGRQPPHQTKVPARLEA